jgi:hypothetical protein
MTRTGIELPAPFLRESSGTLAMSAATNDA